MASGLNSENRYTSWTYSNNSQTLSSSSGAESEFVSLTSSWSKVYTLNRKAINQGQVKLPGTAVAIFKTGKRKLRQVLKSLGKNNNDQGLSSCRLFESRNWEVTAHTSHSARLTLGETSPAGHLHSEGGHLLLGKEDEIRPHSTVIEMLQEWDFWIN